MKYKFLGNTDIKISLICLGTMTWGEQNTEEEAHEQIDYALEHGINFLDTAELYPVPPREKTQGRTEDYIGTWFKKNKKRDKLIIASKIIGPGSFAEHIRKKSLFKKDQIREALHDSLKRLQTDYIDLYQLHWPARRTNFFGQPEYAYSECDTKQDLDNISEALESLSQFVQEGKIRHIGLSNETAWGTMKFLELSKNKEKNLAPIVSVQNPYNLLNRIYETSLSEISHREGVSLLAYSPLAFGVLSGKYLEGARPKKARLTLFKRFDRYTTSLAEKCTLAYLEIAKEYNLSLTQLALAFVNTRPFVASNIIGATSLAQLKENMDSISISLEEEIIKKINAVHKENPNPCP